MLAAADILIEDTQPGSAAESLLGVDQLRCTHPALIVLSISDFGRDSDFSDWQVTAPVLHALTSELSRSGIPGRRPRRLRDPRGRDAGARPAVRDRGDGVGRSADGRAATQLGDRTSALPGRSLSGRLRPYLPAGKTPVARDVRGGASRATRVFRWRACVCWTSSHLAAGIAGEALVRDGHQLSDGPTHDAPWGLFPADLQALCRVLDRPGLAPDPELDSRTGRDRNRARVDGAVTDWTVVHSPGEARLGVLRTAPRLPGGAASPGRAAGPAGARSAADAAGGVSGCAGVVTLDTLCSTSSRRLSSAPPDRSFTAVVSISSTASVTTLISSTLSPGHRIARCAVITTPAVRMDDLPVVGAEVLVVG